MTITFSPSIYGSFFAAGLSEGLLCASDHDFKSSGRNPPAGGIPPGGGDRFGSRTPPMGNLLTLFRERIAAGHPAPLVPSLNTVLNAYASVRAKQDQADLAIEAMTASLAVFMACQLDLLSPSAWTLAASALFAAGHVVLVRGENPEVSARSAELVRAASDFMGQIDVSEEGRRSLPPEDRFLHDRLVADMTLSLKGWLGPDALPSESAEPLGALLARMGIASGVSAWPANLISLPNLTGAVWNFFEGGNPSIFRGARLLKPFSYFEAAAAWRPESTGYQELILASVLGGDPIHKTLFYAGEALKLFPGDALLERMNVAVVEAVEENDDRGELLSELTEISGASPAYAERRDVSLPAFLKTALETLQ